MTYVIIGGAIYGIVVVLMIMFFMGAHRGDD